MRSGGRAGECCLRWRLGSSLPASIEHARREGAVWLSTCKKANGSALKKSSSVFMNMKLRHRGRGCQERQHCKAWQWPEQAGPPEAAWQASPVNNVVHLLEKDLHGYPCT